MATCTVTLTTDKLAISGALVFEPLPSQVIAGVAIDTTPILASVTGANTYEAALTQKASYLIRSERFSFSNLIVTCPASSTATLTDLINGLRHG